MLKSQIVLAATFLAFSSSMVLAESSNTGPTGHLVEESPVSAQELKTKQEKLDVLASKFEELEAKMERLFPESFLHPQGLSDLKTNPYDSQVVRTMQSWSSMDHLAEAKATQQEAEALEKKIQSLQNQIDRYSKKPHLDTKGFRRSGLEILKGNLTKELREATQKTAWHKSQASTIMISESNNQQRS